MSSPLLSVVVPVHNEAQVLAELVRRLKEAALQLEGEVELLLVDDASTDDSSSFFEAMEGVTLVRLEDNVGQFRATCAGLDAAKGELVAVLDGDLQDPPEALKGLIAVRGDSELAFAVKSARVDPLWFRIGRAIYRALAHLGSGAPPSGAGSYCVMTRALAERVVACTLPAANLAAVAVSRSVQRGPWPTHTYAKAARYDGRSRVGFFGLVAEALGSLHVMGALVPLVTLGLAGLGALRFILL